MLFAYSEKCLDRLWLNDTCYELIKMAYPSEILELIRRMNSKAILAIHSQVGHTSEIALNDIVKHGIMMGQILCIVESGCEN